MKRMNLRSKLQKKKILLIKYYKLNVNKITYFFFIIIILEFDKNLIDEEGFPRADLEFGELANYRDLKRNIRG